ncbi:MAG: histone deacetylase [Spirochaetales bacterium]|nr:histone deacetylase [Spirochaetales bacterium]
MIIYSEEGRTGLLEYGIQVPVLSSRALKTFEHLLADPELARRRAEWHRPHDGTVITREDLARAHSEQYLARLSSPHLEEEIIRAFELRDAAGRPYRYDPQRASRPLTELLERALYTISGTYQCAREALSTQFCFYFGGGHHHAHRDFGKGFCLLNDIVVAVRKLQAEGTIRTAWVVDVDAHKGDGTAALTAGDDTVRTLSVHMARGWPLDEPPVDARGRPNPSFVPSDIDVPVDSGEEAQYIPRLVDALERLAGLPLGAGASANLPPEGGRARADLAVVVAGADPYEADELPSARLLRLSRSQMLERDQTIYLFLETMGVPAAFLMSGGYGERSWEVFAQFLHWALRRRLGLGPEGPAPGWPAAGEPAPGEPR